MKRAALSVTAVAVLSASFALAQTQNPAPARPAPKSSSQQGATAPAASQAQGGAGGVQQCIGCHGERGEGNPQSGIPRIAGQSETYLLRQLESYANGSRRNAVMQPIAKGLSKDVRQAGAAFYAGLPPAGNATSGSASTSTSASASTRSGSHSEAKNGTTGSASGAKSSSPDATTGSQRPSTSARGEELATIGDGRHQVQACGNCHGPGGVGEAPEIPYLAGQDAAYLVAALNEFKNGARRNDPGAQMRTVVRGLTAEDMNAVAQYYAALQAPARPMPSNVVQAPGGQPAAGAGRSAASQQPATGPRGQVGSEQGAGTTGGSQGAGGADQSSGNAKGGSPKGR